MENIEKKRYYTVDLIKLVTSICVIAIHTKPLFFATNTYFINFYSFIVQQAVPFFFLASGFFLFKKLEGLSSKSEKLDCVKKFIIKNLTFYLIWTAIYLPISIFGILRAGGGRVSLNAVIQSVINFVCVGEQFYSWPLWYLLSSIYAGAFIWFCLKCNLKKSVIFLLALGVYFIAWAMTYLAGSYETSSGLIRTLGYLIKRSFGSGRVFTGIAYICSGMLFLKEFDRKKTIIASIVGFVLFSAIGVFWGGFTETPLLLCPAVLLFAFALCEPIHFKWNGVRAMSVFNYYTHMIVFFIYSLTIGDFAGINQYGVLPFVVVTGVCIVSFLLLSCIKNKRVAYIEKRLFGIQFYSEKNFES